MNDLSLLYAFVLSVAALVGALKSFITWRRRGRAPRSLVLAGLLLILGVWLSPWVQSPLHRRAQEQLRDRIAAYRGAQIDVLVSELGLPQPAYEMSLVGVFQGGVSHSATLEAMPWYAPFGAHHVCLLVSERDTLIMVHVDD